MKFTDLSLLPEIIQALEKLGFETPTEIQEKAIPLLLEKNIDFHGQAQTGTGKTLAFGIPLLQLIDRSSRNTQALIIAPTRELVNQITQSMEEAARFMKDVTIAPVYGGVSIVNQIRQLKRGAQIVVGTPGRLNDHLKRGTLQLKDLQTIVLDEADIMLDMGFKQEINDILKHAPKKKTIWLFSATVKKGIKDLMKSHMHNPASLRVSKSKVGSENTEQFFSIIPQRNRIVALMRFIDAAPEFYGFVFCRTKILTGQVAEALAKAGYTALALHGDMNQVQRNKVIKRFKNKEFSILVATDVAARGIDVADATHVINFSFPEDHEGYIHRIGRTGRAGKKGIAITFVSRSELRLISMIKRKFNIDVQPIDVPSTQEIMSVRVIQAREYLDSLNIKDIFDHNVMKELHTLVQGIPQDKLVKVVVKLLHDSYFKEKENGVTFSSSKDVSLDAADHEMQEIYLNVGSDDGITTDDVLDFIEEHAKVSSDQFQKVKLLKRRCYIVSTGKTVTGIINQVRGKKLGGRRVMAFVSDDYLPQGGQRGRERRPSRGRRPSRRFKK